MSLSAFENLLKEAMGLDAASITSAMVERSVRGRMALCGLAAPQEGLYLERLRSSPVELQALIETVVVPETWFFRDCEVFTALGRIAAEARTARPASVFRVLSLPCATGEEPYTMAMALFDAGLPSDRFRIDAVDISHRVIELAKRAVYGKNSFRGDDLAFRGRYFREESAGWQLEERVKAQVHFQPGNLVDPSLLPGTGNYDAVFCRNVLIYFGPEARDRVIETLDRLLTPEGFLFMGPSETSLLPGHRFIPARLPRAYAFRKLGIGPSSPEAAPQKKVLASVVSPKARPKPATKAAVRSNSTAPANPPVPKGQGKPAVDSLDEARRLADEGRLSEAAALCEAHLAAHGPSARLFYLFGLVRDAAREHREAIQFYRKALYLDPRNGEVMFHLASLLESQGETAEARLLNDRARRLAVMGGKEGR